MLKFKQLFPSKHSVIAMVHAQALPGTPNYKGSVQKIIDTACTETEIYLKNNVNGIIVENMNDVPYIKSKKFGPETTAIMTKICTEIRKLVPKNIPCGIQILTGGNREAIAVAKATSFNFIRSEGFVFSHIGDEGFIQADAGLLLRYRKYIDAEDVAIFTDIKKKHSSHAITSDVSLVDTAHAVEFFQSNGIILTGTATGNPADEDELNDLKSNSVLPIIIGSGITQDNIHRYLAADAFIIGSYFKVNGYWQESVCDQRVQSFMSYFTKLVQSND